MRKLLFSLLLATTVATPALTRPPVDKDGKRPVRVEQRSEVPKAAAQQRARRPQVRQQRRVQVQAPVRTQVQQQRRAQVQAPVRTQVQRQRPAIEQRVQPPARVIQRQVNVNERGRPTLQQQRQQPTGSVSNWRQSERQQVTQRQTEQRVDRNHVRAPAGARPDRPAPPPQTAYNRDSTRQWNTSWRNDRRYDWRSYRNQHRTIFRLGLYYDPFGWGYQRYNVGWRLWPSYYASTYWLNDPAMFSLPYAPWPYKWVRYYDDALLVDTMSGQVVDVMYDFFW